MLVINDTTDIYISNTAVDMRKAIDGLCVLVVDMLDKSPQEDALFIFYNKAKDKVKILVWHKNGFILFYKRLERGKFKIPNKIEDTLIITKQQLTWLISGLDFMLMDEFNELNFEGYF